MYRINIYANWNFCKMIFTYGLSFFIVQVAGSLVTVILNKSLVKYGGNVAVSGMGIINSLSTLLVLPLLGLVQGARTNYFL